MIGYNGSDGSEDEEVINLLHSGLLAEDSDGHSIGESPVGRSVGRGQAELWGK